MKVGEWAWSLSEEGGFCDTFDSRELALANACEELEHGPDIVQVVHVGQIDRVAVVSEAYAAAIDRDTLEETAADYVADNYACEDPDRHRMGLTTELLVALEAKLKTTVYTWAQENGLDKGFWYVMGKTEAVAISEDDRAQLLMDGAIATAKAETDALKGGTNGGG